MSLMYPNGVAQADRDFMAKGTLREMRNSPETTFWKVVDTEVQENKGVVGVAEWKIFEKPRTAEELSEADKSAGEDGLAPGADPDVMRDFGGAVKKGKEAIIGGKPYICELQSTRSEIVMLMAIVDLHILATLPNHHRRGVGKLHLDWGLSEADRLGLPVYLEGSLMGQPLYARCGFENVMPFPFDETKFGAKTSMAHMCMLRPAKTTSGSS